MNTYADKVQENKSSSSSKQQSVSVTGAKLEDNRPASIAQMKLQEMAGSSPQMQQLKASNAIADNRPGVKQLKNNAAITDNRTSKTIQLKETTPNKTGLPDQLKSGVENLSGISMDEVKVHYNSDKPAQLQAHAYAQGTDIHVAAGQEKHLPHEAWHVVQQKQGRVQPTMQLKSGVNINDDKGLEKEADQMGEKAAVTGSSKPVQKMAKPLNSNTATVQKASVYNGAAINSATGAWGTQNLKIKDQFTYGGSTGHNTAISAHADRIDGSWTGAGVSSFPQDWAKFTQLVGPYAVRNLVQGHMINELIGGNGNAENLAPITCSANSRHLASVERPIKTWLAADDRNVVDYKVTPVYGNAKAALKNKLIAEFKTVNTISKANTQPNLKNWVGAYIDSVIPRRIDIQANFMQANAANAKARQKGQLNASINNAEAATFAGDKIRGTVGNWSAFNLGITDTITNGGVTAFNTGSWGYAKRIDNLHAGSAVAAKPTHWLKFTQLVGPDAVGYLVQGHLVNQKVGGTGVAANLTPLTTSANSLHETKVEGPIKNWLNKPAAHNQGPYLIDYKVTPVYGGANGALKTSLLASFKDTNNEHRADTRPNLIIWLNAYIDAVFPEQLDISVSFMKSNQPWNTRNVHARAKARPVLNGNITNVP